MTPWNGDPDSDWLPEDQETADEATAIRDESDLEAERKADEERDER